MAAENKANPLLIVISGPSGVGKDTLLARMKERGGQFHFAVTATTRPKRPGERNGVDYHFIPREEFEQMIEREELLEWANVYGHLYGVPKDEVRRGLAQGLDVLLKVDVQGAATIKRMLPQAVFIFLAPPSLQELEARLKGRKTESAKQFSLRMDTARREMDSLPMFDYMVVHHYDETEAAIEQIEAIVRAEKRRTRRGAMEV